jgi:serine/threonine-protein kinase RsbW
MGIVGSKTRSGDSPQSNKGKRRVVSGIAKKSPLKFEIPSDHHHQREVQNAILDEVTRIGFNSQSTFAIKLALEEAMINAVKHGNKLNPKKKVKIEAKITPKMAEIVIEDQGPGFDRSSVPDPTEDENLEKCSGRGILLMESYMNSVSWSHGGRRVKMVKKNDAELHPRH